MNIAIAGAGIAGGYLAKVLEQKGISPDIYDGMNHDTRCGCRSCGWGVPRGIERYLSDIGLDFDSYLLESMSSMNFNGLAARTPLCTLNKPRLIKDLTKGTRLKQENLGMEEAAEYDLIVDATGIARTFLPPCRSDLVMPTLQLRVMVTSNGSETLKAGVYGNKIPGLVLILLQEGELVALAFDEEFTAGAYITTDKADNQITGFNPGAMKHRAGYSLGKADGGAICLIAPGSIERPVIRDEIGGGRVQISGGMTTREANDIARQLLFDIAHAIGKQDAKSFHRKMELREPIAKLAQLCEPAPRRRPPETLRRPPVRAHRGLQPLAVGLAPRHHRRQGRHPRPAQRHPRPLPPPCPSRPAARLRPLTGASRCYTGSHWDPPERHGLLP